jgi:hypothetical protein
MINPYAYVRFGFDERTMFASTRGVKVNPHLYVRVDLAGFQLLAGVLAVVDVSVIVAPVVLAPAGADVARTLFLRLGRVVPLAECPDGLRLLGVFFVVVAHDV